MVSQRRRRRRRGGFEAARRRREYDRVRRQARPVAQPNRNQNENNAQNVIQLNLPSLSPETIRCIEEFDRMMQRVDVRICERCQRSGIDLNMHDDFICNICSTVNGRLYLPENNMDPGIVPPELTGLSHIEEVLIARIHPVISFYRRSRGGQLHYSGNVINFRQDVTQLYTTLPPTREDVMRIIAVITDDDRPIRELQIRPGRVRTALRWLQNNHQYYRDIIIDEERLDDYDRNPNFTPILQANDELQGVPDQDINERNNDNIEADNVITANSEDFHQGYYPDINDIDHNDIIFRGNGENPRWPHQERNPVNEFETEGYISQAFPTLFPYGNADLNMPRTHRISKPTDYFRFLLSYSDGRFAQHTRFRFFAMNTTLRWQALDYARIYARRNNFENMTIEEARELLQRQPGLANSIMVYIGKLRSTKPYWMQRSAELKELVEYLGMPGVFFTLSAADFSWPDLFRLLEPNRQPEDLTNREKQQLLTFNPLRTAEFFKKRIDLYFATVMTPVFRIRDYWYRFEWQWRGSPHIHGILWLENSPDFTTLNDDNRQQFLEYCDNMTKAWNPDLNRLPPARNPSCFRFIDVEDYEADLADIVNHLQKHSRCGNSCLRRHRRTNEIRCRYGFPKELQDNSGLSDETGHLCFTPRRNDPLLSRYNEIVSQSWRANTDFSVITNMNCVINYISKYASKAETSSLNFHQLLRNLANIRDDDETAHSAIRSIVMKSVADRDYSAQEVSHIIMGWPLYECSRIFVTLVISNDEWIPVDQVRNSTSSLNKYKRREAQYDHINLQDYTQYYDMRAGVTRHRRVAAVLRVFPKVQRGLNPEMDLLYYKVQCILRIPWRDNWEEILENLNVDGVDNPWAYAFRYHELGHIEIENLPIAEEEFYHSDDDNQLNRVEEDLAAMRGIPDVNNAAGAREIDVNYDWNEAIDFEIDQQRITRFWQQLREIEPQQNIRNVEFNLSDDQQSIIDICSLQLDQLEHDQPVNIRRIMVQGKAGTGKSTVIQQIISMVTDRLGGNAIKIIAPTGCAAINIGGATMHSAMRLQVKQFQQLRGRAQREFQNSMADVKFIIIDEISMVGLHLFHQFETRCREARPNSNLPFAGFIIYCFGDFRQLPPVRDTPIYGEKEGDLQVERALLAISLFQEWRVLRTCHRQNNLDQATFRRLLDDVAVGVMTSDTYDLLMTRRLTVLSDRERNDFNTAVRLYPTNEQVSTYNHDYLMSLGTPIVRIEAIHNEPAASAYSADQASGLEAVLELSIGARVMLRKNLLTRLGLVNGALGSVTGIVYADDQGPPTMPIALMIHFDRYEGVTYINNSIPIVPDRVTWVARNKHFSRTQFPIQLAYSITIHKSQGLTLDRAVIDIGKRENTAGTTYVALSRVRTLEGIVIERVYPLCRFTSIAQVARRREEWLRDHNLTL